MSSLKAQYQDRLRYRKEISSRLVRVNVLWDKAYKSHCFHCQFPAHNCESNGHCPLDYEKVQTIFDLMDSFKWSIKLVTQEIDILKERLITRYEIKRIARLNKKARKNNPLGSWIHVFNEHVSNWTEYISNFSKIQGEVCVSKESDYQFACRKQFIGVKLEGRLTAQWNYDCWSRVIANGKRWGTRNGGNHRNEGWIIPANSKITAIVCSRPTKDVLRISREFNLNIEILDSKPNHNW